MKKIFNLLVLMIVIISVLPSCVVQICRRPGRICQEYCETCCNNRGCVKCYCEIRCYDGCLE